MARHSLWKGRARAGEAARPRGAPGAPARGPRRAGPSAGTSSHARVSAGDWELIEGEDIENEAVLEQHRLGLQMRLLGEGTPEGYVDHEFPPRSKSIDGLDGHQVKKGQEALIELIATQRPLEDDDAEPPEPNAPRCHCGRRARRNRVRVPGPVRGRPYFRCAARSCRLMSFGDLGSSPQAQNVRWLRFETGRLSSGRHFVLGNEGFRPEDCRLGGRAASSGSRLVDALALLAERPALLARCLPNAVPGDESSSGCHEVRLCASGRWRALLVDEWLPVSPGASSSGSGGAGRTAGPRAGQNDHESLLFGRSAGNQLWLPLLEKAYAKAFGAYDFAFPGTPLDEVLADFTGAPVETLRLGATSRSTAGGAMDVEELWRWLRGLQERDVLMACSTQGGSHGQAMVHAILELAEADEPRLGAVGLGSCRAVRLRNPRTGFHAVASYKEVLALLRGVAADGTTHGNGSFWVEFPHDFLSAFSRLDVCHAMLAGGAIGHTCSFDGEFVAGKGLGTRGCALELAVGEAAERVDCWVTAFQPLPPGARLLRPAIGRVLNDLGLLVLNEADLTADALVMGGAWDRTTCRISLEPDRSYVLLPFSFRAWPGPFWLRIQASAPVCTRSVSEEDYVSVAWGVLLQHVASLDPVPAHADGLGVVSRSSYPLTFLGSCGRRIHGAELAVLRLPGAALAVARNPHPSVTLLVDCRLEACHAALHTARGGQLGDWAEERNEAAWAAAPGEAAAPDWRRYAAEDVVPPGSWQLLWVLLAVAPEFWAFEVGGIQASEVPADVASSRPADHPFAPRRMRGAGPPRAGVRGQRRGGEADEVVEGLGEEEREAFRLAVELSLHEAYAADDQRPPCCPGEPPTEERGQRTGRWSRHARPVAIDPAVKCVVCSETLTEPAPLACCSQRVCGSCARCWAAVLAVDQGADEICCPACARPLADGELPPLLEAPALATLRARRRERQAAAARPAPSEADLGLAPGQLARLGAKRCPACGTGVAKEAESCHKMICRTCRAKFCFRCLTRLEYFNCGCSGAEHKFVDPVDGRIIAH